MEFNGKTVVVTGAGSGMGREVVLAALAKGARVAAVDLRPEGLQELATLANAGARLSTHVLDIVDRKMVSLLPGQVEKLHGVVIF